MKEFKERLAAKAIMVCSLYCVIATADYDKVTLKCQEDHMSVDVETSENFSGILYTRGSFRKAECSYDAHTGRNFQLNIPLKGCNTKSENALYTNVLVLQHDDDLIIKGDAAFKLVCDYSPKVFTIRNDNEMVFTTNSTFTEAINNDPSFTVSATITLVDPDPSAKSILKHKKASVSNTTNIVVLTHKREKPFVKKI
ncbi:uncharacterized protein LOC106468541 [Limulus polyphemus]|uniref:Uncharacterized protein LOC106468541 n=1 Tax=Limulus polyphemus TaxID=6850 RepID=A0ABM1T9M7_LIMPO|nr:uncharacterized protein LOC106468541 [Limulus polyphemus]XP_022252583.1 uncharacterized protein LOC106468541 [Limulus polyphemus]